MPQHVLIGDELVEVPHVYTAWLPGTPPPWAPAPKPYDENARTEWAGALYGETWLEDRGVMLRERQIYSHGKDPVYLKRQRRLRAIEDAVEGRQLAGGKGGSEWKTIWALMQEDTAPAEPSQSLQLDAENSGVYLTASSMSQTWENLKLQRRVCQWSEEEYRYQCMERGCRMLREAKDRCEDAIGDRKHKETLDMLNNLRAMLTSHPDSRRAAAYDRALHFYGRLRQGDAQDRVLSDWAAAEESARQRWTEPQEDEADAIYAGAMEVWQMEYITSTGDNNSHRSLTSSVPSQRQSQVFTRTDDSMDPESDDRLPGIDSEICFMAGPSLSLEGDAYAGSDSDIDMQTSMPEEAPSPAWSYVMISTRDCESMSDVRDTKPAGQSRQDAGKRPLTGIRRLFNRRRPSPTRPHAIPFRNIRDTFGGCIRIKRKDV